MHNQAGVTNGREVKYPRLAWVANAGGNIFMASPIVADGTVFTATVDNDMDGRSAVVALDARTGAEKMEIPTANSVKKYDSIFLRKGIRRRCRRYCLRIGCGYRRTRMEKEIGSRLSSCYLRGTCGAWRYVICRRRTRGLSALNASDGSRFWKNEDFGQACGTVTTMTLAGNTLISSAHWDALYGTNIKNGQDDLEAGGFQVFVDRDGESFRLLDRGKWCLLQPQSV